VIKLILNKKMKLQRLDEQKQEDKRKDIMEKKNLKLRG